MRTPLQIMEVENGYLVTIGHSSWIEPDWDAAATRVAEHFGRPHVGVGGQTLDSPGAQSEGGH